jgi:hypothetical protein
MYQAKQSGRNRVCLFTPEKIAPIDFDIWGINK